MTTTQPSPAIRRLLPTAVGAGAAAQLLMLIGTYLWTPWREFGPGGWALDTDGKSLGELLLIVGFAVAGAAVVFAVVVPWALRREPERTAVLALVVAIVAVVSVAAFWTGLPVILASGAVVLARDARHRLGRLPASAVVAIVLAAATGLIAIAIAFTG